MCLKSAVYAEARGESREGQQAVSSVILNRSANSGSTPCVVVRKRGQFRFRRPPKDFTIDLSDPDRTGGAVYFRNYPGQWHGRRFMKQIDHHYFYKD